MSDDQQSTRSDIALWLWGALAGAGLAVALHGLGFWG